MDRASMDLSLHTKFAHPYYENFHLPQLNVELVSPKYVSAHIPQLDLQGSGGDKVYFVNKSVQDCRMNIELPVVVAPVAIQLILLP